MSNLVIGPSYVLPADSGGDSFTLNNPIIGYGNQITIGSVSASAGSDANWPIINLANPATNLKWKSATFGEQYIIVGNGVLPITLDYMAVAKHNFFTAQIAVSVESSPDGVTYTQLTAPVIPGNNGPVMCLFGAMSALFFRLRMQASVAFFIPEIGIMFTGISLHVQRRIYVGHTPINYGRIDNIVNGMSDSGQFLGRILLGSNKATSISLKNLTPTWYRSTLDPFIIDAKTNPFFFAWRPDTYPNEVGYCWLTNDPKPINQLSNGMMGIDLQFSGVT